MKPVHTIELKHAAVDGRGHRLPLTLLHLTVRDLFLRAAAEIHCAGLSDRQAAGCTPSSLATGNAHGKGTASRRSVHQGLPGASTR